MADAVRKASLQVSTENVRFFSVIHIAPALRRGTLSPMNQEAQRLLNEAVRVAGLKGSFDAVEVGEGIGLNRGQAESAARALSNAGILSLGFDNAAQFTADYRKVFGPQWAAKGKLTKERVDKPEKVEKTDKASKDRDVKKSRPDKAVVEIKREKKPEKPVKLAKKKRA
jgi:hypothetical protein